MFDLMNNLKVQTYLNNQNLSEDTVNKLDSMKFNEMYTNEEFSNIKANVEAYRSLENLIKENPSPEVSKKMEELNHDILYATGKDASKVQLSELYTTQDLDQAFMETNLRSKNDLWVELDYEDYSSSSNYIKCKVVGHDSPCAYGISANARIIVTRTGKVITTKNAIYPK